MWYLRRGGMEAVPKAPEEPKRGVVRGWPDRVDRTPLIVQPAT